MKTISKQRHNPQEPKVQQDRFGGPSYFAMVRPDPVSILALKLQFSIRTLPGITRFTLLVRDRKPVFLKIYFSWASIHPSLLFLLVHPLQLGILLIHKGSPVSLKISVCFQTPTSSGSGLSKWYQSFGCKWRIPPSTFLWFHSKQHRSDQGN